jgi:hypothetical protein
MKKRPFAWLVLLAGTAVLLMDCAKFVKLGSDVDFMAGTYIISGAVENAERYPRLYGLVVEWDQAKNEVLSVDRARVGSLGVFAFFVKRAGHQYVLAYSDTNANDAYDAGEPAWIAADEHGRFVPVVVNGVTRRGTATLIQSVGLTPGPVRRSVFGQPHLHGHPRTTMPFRRVGTPGKGRGAGGREPLHPLAFYGAAPCYRFATQLGGTRYLQDQRRGPAFG